MSDVSGPLPNIGAFAGSAVPEPSPFVELGTGLLMLVGAWGWRKDRTRTRQHLFQIPRNGAACIPFVSFQIPRNGAACIPFVSGLFVCLFLLATIPAPVPAGTITVDDIDQPISMMIAAASVPEPSSLTLGGGVAALILGVALRYRSGVRSAGRLPLDRSRLHKK